MAEILSSVSGAELHLNPVLLFGVVILGGIFGSRLFQKLHIPQPSAKSRWDTIGWVVVREPLKEIRSRPAIKNVFFYKEQKTAYQS